jgi:hypothetical protein
VKLSKYPEGAVVTLHVGGRNDAIDSVELNYDEDGMLFVDLIGETTPDEIRNRLRDASISTN